MGQELQQEDDHHHHNAKPTNFFPMFCKLSLKDIKPQNPIIIAKPFSGEPGSPIVTCTGQVRRSSRVTGFPAVAGHHRHRKPISTKSVLPNAALVGGAARTCRSSKELCHSKRVKAVAAAQAAAINGAVDIGDMDPPVPVRAPPPPPEVNLWRRRRRNGGGVGIERLQIEEIKVGNYCRFGFRSPAPPPPTAG